MLNSILHGHRNIKIISNGIDFADIAQIEGNMEQNDIVYAGRLIREKCVDILLEAISIVSNYRKNVKCVIIGEGPEKNRLVRLAYDLGITNNVTFKDFIPDYKQLIAHIKTSRVLALPSLSEGFGIIAIEANACGVPVVTSSQPSNAAKDLIHEGYNGFVYGVTAEELAKNLLSVLDTPKDKWISNCTDIARQYDWDAIVCDLERYYNDLIAS